MTSQWLRTAGRVFPRGSLLSPAAWAFRHRLIVFFALASSLGVSAFAVLQGAPFLQALIAGALPAALAITAWTPAFGRRLSSSLGAASLMVLAAMVVNISGTVEAQLLFFIMVPVVALYEDWAPVATASVLVLNHRSVLSIIAPDRLYDRPEAVAEPLNWSLVHSGLFLAICLTSILHWKIHEHAKTEENILLDRLTSQALHDPLTGLANRTLLHDKLCQAIAAAAAEDTKSLLVFCIDIDGFKPVNDSYGHAAGDRLLAELGRRLQSCIRTGDTAARTGGDEFILLLPDSGTDIAAPMAQRIMDAIAAPVPAAGTALNVTASVGIAIGSGFEDPEELLERADKAMYSAKHTGRERYVIYGAAITASDQGGMSVHPEHARAWAHYTRALRAQISAAKTSGTLPHQTRGPETARRILDSLLAAIDLLPQGSQPAALALPQGRALEEFIFHHDLVQNWADELVTQNILTLRRPETANEFWIKLRQTITTQTQIDSGPRNRPFAANLPLS
ncbi:diguanylate cyclase [Arthrobacter oryzae]|uniref:GGDEF domain-containing protein n=1 Tax=Arthrobacter oryzae TaxID=409290 RepID=UPI0016062F5B|nr:GGDEF domain-containing protein [Arthrobacter oryzae]